MSDFLEDLRKLSPKQLMLLAYDQHERLQAAVLREPIAIIGIGCRLPGASGPDEFWRLLERGGDAIRDVPTDRWDAGALFDPDPDAPGLMATRAGGFLDDIAGFDAAFFGISPREARSMDPQQRLLLEVAWEALENAGLPPDQLADTATGIYVGQCNGDYLLRLLRRGQAAIDGYLASGTSPSVTSGRLAYCLGLRGPAMTVDTSCSSSLVALHLACQALRAGEARLALAGGVNLICAPEAGIAMSKAHMLAPDGRSKAFDEAADGFGRGEGCGVLVLKRLSDARADGDRIAAIIRGSAINQDGRSAGLTVPNGPAQEAVIAAALADAGVAPAEIGYVEAHGTGTKLGDPIEARALSNALRAGRADAPKLLIGSVKANIGHLEAAAGVAGVIKAVLCLQHGRIPPQPQFRVGSPHIPWADMSLAVAAHGQAWPPGASRLAGVSSFGFSGTNAHVVLEQPPDPDPTSEIDPTSGSARSQAVCLPLSARSVSSLRALATRTAALLEQGANLTDVALAAGCERTHHPLRLAVVTARAGEAADALRAYATAAPHPALLTAAAAGAAGGTVFMFPSQGTGPDAAWPEPCAAPENGEDASMAFARALAALYVGGASIAWTRLAEAGVAKPRGTVRLPTYPFDRQRYWVDLPAPEPAITRQPDQQDGLFYQVRWHPLPATPAIARVRSWVLAGGPDGFATALAARLRARGERVTMLAADAPDQAGRDPDADLIYLGALSLGADSSAEACTALACATPIGWLAGLAASDRDSRQHPGAGSGRAWLVTAGAQPVPEKIGPAGRFQAPLWGVGRVFALEHPARWGGLVDLPPGAPLPAQLDALLDALDTQDAEDQIAYRNGMRHVARLERAAAPPARAPVLSPDATYLVTGGFGGLGPLIGRWLADHGARHIALLGRTPDMSSAPVRAIEAAGARIIPLAADVADPAALRRALSQLAGTAPPLRGIVHAATNVALAPITELTLQAAAAMARPKIAGLLALEQLAPALDFLVLFSSTAALTGAAGMAHYAAANAFLDATAHQERPAGRVLSVNWGSWEVMRAASAADHETLRQGGLRPLRAEIALQALGHLLAGDAPQMAVADIDWSRLKPLYERARPRPLLAAFAAPPAAAPAASPQAPPVAATLALLERLSDASAEARAELLEAFVRQEVARALAMPDAAAVPPDAGLFDLGMDSLMAVALQRALERAIGRTLPATLTFNHPTAASLARYLAALLHPAAAAPPDAMPPPATASDPASDIDALSDAEIEQLLRARLESVG
jgi:acyl transferase domain-containing protein/acyl carrier protein